MNEGNNNKTAQGENNITIKKYGLYTFAFVLAIPVIIWLSSVLNTSAIKTHGEMGEIALLDCFPKNSMVKKKDKEKAIICEASGVTYLENEKKVIIVHDKSVPADVGSAIFKTAYTPESTTLNNAVQYLQNPAINHAQKYEDITLTTDKKYVIATTAFDRVKKGETGWDNYNSLIYWPVSKPERAKVVSNSKAKNSVHLREKIANALQLADPYYFKIEGLTALNNRLLFGIRELGESYEKFAYTFKIVSVSYAFNDGQLQLNDDFKQHKLNLESTDKTDSNKKMGLSGLEYDADNERLYVLGSYEKKTESGDKQLGGALWVLTLEAFNSSQPAHPILLKNNNNPLYFSHKAEGITLLDAERLLIIYDDDKKLITGQDKREPHQAAYSVIQLF